MDQEKADAVLDSGWLDEGSPFAIGPKKLGMWLFIVFDSITFSALLISYSYERLASPDWPRPFAMNPDIALSAVMTVVLLASSLMMVLAVIAAHRGDRKGTVLWMAATIAGGLIFTGLLLSNWMHLISAEHILPWANPLGSPLFGATFFSITGWHLLQVLIGVIYLGIVAVGFGRGKFSAETVEISGLYWHFVSLVWIFVFSMIYLMSLKY